MRRKDRQINNRAEIDAIVCRAAVCRLAMVDNGEPYIVPLCFGYRDNTLYFHTANEGKKLEILKKNNRVCFEMEVDCRLKKVENACKCSMAYKSVVGTGRAFIVTQDDLKTRALDIIMQHYTDASAKQSWVYPEGEINKTTIIKVEIERMTAKQSL